MLVTYVAWGGWCAYARNGGGQVGCSAGMLSFGVFTAVVATGHAQGTRDGSRGPKWITQSNDKCWIE